MRWHRILLALFVCLGLQGADDVSTVLRLSLRSEPRTLHPLLGADLASVTVRYLTGGVLVRINRLTQQQQPALASSWKILESGRRIDFVLRPNLHFSDGTPFGPEDVVYTVNQLMDPKLHSPIADSFRVDEGVVLSRATGPHSVSIRFPRPIADLAGLFDQIPVMSSRSPLKEKAVLGPYRIAEQRAGVYLLLDRNPWYFEKDSQGVQLPYIPSIRLVIQQNRESEGLQLQRRDLDLIQDLEPELFDRLSKGGDSGIRTDDAGPSMDSELVWFNQTPNSDLPAWKKAWFANVHFRRAISMAIDRSEICRIVYRNHAVPALGPVSPANHFWFNDGLPPRGASPGEIAREFTAAGFHNDHGELRDGNGNRLEFSLISAAGNKTHDRILVMIQQDLARAGVRLNIVSLDFSSLLERITRTFHYEACMLALTNVGLDPNEQMNVWLSSAGNHQWNPDQKTPATPWEARIDRLMMEQASSLSPIVRKHLFDEVQSIVRDQEPFIYLVHPDALSAASTRVRNFSPALLAPQASWNIERLRLASSR